MSPSTSFVAAHPDCVHDRCAPWASPGKPDRIVVHVMEGSFKGTKSWFQKGKGGSRGNAPTAAHYLISNLGDICQMVPDAKSCYHAGSRKEAHWNDRSLGIELEGWTGKTVFSDALLTSAAKVVAILCRTYGIPVDRQHILGHSEVPGATHTDPGSTFDWTDFMARVAAS